MKRFLPRPTYANVVATLALFVALGGSAFAATQLPKNSVGPKQLRRAAVTPAKLSAASRATLAGPTGPKGEAGAKGAPGAPGAPGEDGEPGSAKAWARVSNTGVVLASSGNVSVSKVGTGDYCVDAGAFNSTNSVAVATPDNSDPATTAGDTVVISEAELSNDCHGTHDFDVLGSNAAGDEQDLGFAVAIP